MVNVIMNMSELEVSHNDWMRAMRREVLEQLQRIKIHLQIDTPRWGVIREGLCHQVMDQGGLGA